MVSMVVGTVSVLLDTMALTFTIRLTELLGDLTLEVGARLLRYQLTIHVSNGIAVTYRGVTEGLGREWWAGLPAKRGYNMNKGRVWF